MRDAPALPRETILSILRDHYARQVDEVTFLPIGNDIGSSAYRADTSSGARFFVKARVMAAFRQPSVLVPACLDRAGVPNIVAPMPAKSGEFWVEAGGFAFSVYPFLDARPAAESGLTEAQWQRLGEIARAIHTAALPVEVARQVPREAFVPWRRTVLDDAARAARSSLADPLQRDLAALWRRHADEIDALGRHGSGVARRRASACAVPRRPAYMERVARRRGRRLDRGLGRGHHGAEGA